MLEVELEAVVVILPRVVEVTRGSPGYERELDVVDRAIGTAPTHLSDVLIPLAGVEARQLRVERTDHVDRSVDPVVCLQGVVVPAEESVELLGRDARERLAALVLLVETLVLAHFVGVPRRERGSVRRGGGVGVGRDVRTQVTAGVDVARVGGRVGGGRSALALVAGDEGESGEGDQGRPKQSDRSHGCLLWPWGSVFRSGYPYNTLARGMCTMCRVLEWQRYVGKGYGRVTQTPSLHSL